MSRTWLILLVSMLLGAGLVLAAGHLARAQSATAPASPVITALPYYQETEFEPDPFDTTRVRSSSMTTQSVVLVHADGTTEIKRLR